MILTYAQARDAIFGAVHTAWSSNSEAIFGGAREMRFQDVEKLEPPAQHLAWGHCAMHVTVTKQAGLRGGSKRRYTTLGVVAVDIFVPRHSSRAALSALAMGDKIRRALEGSRSDGVWYRNATATSSGNTESFVVVRVMADFEYTEEGDSDE